MASGSRVLVGRVARMRAPQGVWMAAISLPHWSIAPADSQECVYTCARPSAAAKIQASPAGAAE
jgi:hypothetical protein